MSDPNSTYRPRAVVPPPPIQAPGRLPLRVASGSLLCSCLLVLTILTGDPESTRQAVAGLQQTPVGGAGVDTMIAAVMAGDAASDKRTDGVLAGQSSEYAAPPERQITIAAGDTGQADRAGNAAAVRVATTSLRGLQLDRPMRPTDGSEKPRAWDSQPAPPAGRNVPDPLEHVLDGEMFGAGMFETADRNATLPAPFAEGGSVADVTPWDGFDPSRETSTRVTGAEPGRHVSRTPVRFGDELLGGYYTEEVVRTSEPRSTRPMLFGSLPLVGAISALAAGDEAAASQPTREVVERRETFLLLTPHAAAEVLRSRAAEVFPPNR